LQISKWTSKKNTYGWARAEVVGALVNSVFLLALCFTIFVEAVTRLFEDEHIENPKLLLIVGSVGLAINVVGLILFGTHSHSHGGGGHGHSHSGGGHGHSHDGGKKCASEQEKDKQLQPLTQNGNIRPEDIPYAQEIVDDTGEDEDDENCTDGKGKAKIGMQ
jgi:Co/Zn/Cd efflux system component